MTHDTSAAPARALAALPEHRQRTFAARVERWRPDLVAALTEVTPGPAEAEALAERLLGVAARRFAERDDDLHDLDERRTLAPDWFQRPGMLGYAAYADRYAGTLAGVGERLDHLRDLGVTYLHLMPLLRPRPAPNDGGYAVMDYRSVREDLGTMDDLRALAADGSRMEEIWPRLPRIAVDHAVAEPAAAAGRVATVPAAFDWEDVGDFDSLAALLGADGVPMTVLGDADVRVVDASGLVVAGGRTVAVVGLDDVVVVDTPDALLVTTRERAQDVKAVVAALKESGRADLT